MLVVALLGVAVAVYARPPIAAYLLLGLTPLIVGMDRGLVIPLLRPNEALALFLAAVVAFRVGVQVLSRRPVGIRFTRLDAAIIAMAIASSVFPLLAMLVRDRDITMDDVLHALTLWKYYMVFVVIRLTIRDEGEVRRCLYVAMAAAAVVGVVAILQSLELLGVPQLLATLYAPFGYEESLQLNRGTSTLASSIAVADVMAFNLAIAVGWLVHENRRRRALFAAATLFVLGTLASGQFSGVIALAVAAVAIAFVTKRVRALLAFVPAMLIATVALQPVLDERLSSFDPSEGLPPSWLARLDNLTTYFWPELFSNFNYVFGVRPSARVSTTAYGSGWVWIESGHTWLLWAGGIPLLLAFLVFLWVGMRTTLPVARARRDAIGVAATAGFVSLVVVGVLMTFDPHLTLRGSADLLFPLLALALVHAPTWLRRHGRTRATA